MSSHTADVNAAQPDQPGAAPEEDGNHSKAEHVTSAVVGSVLAGCGLSLIRRTWGSLAIAAVGGGLLYHGLFGRSSIVQKVRNRIRSSRQPSPDGDIEQPGEERGVHESLAEPEQPVEGAGDGA
jgi:uncharacterized membrane protein